MTHFEEFPRPLAALLGFALWTATLILIQAIHRWYLILGARVVPKDVIAIGDQSSYVPAKNLSRSNWSFVKRITRAHMNCVENLPVFGALVVVAYLSEVNVDTLVQVVLVCRVVQSVAHVISISPPFILVRMTAFIAQMVCMAKMTLAIHAAHPSLCEALKPNFM
eukprot:CAMPEP_0174229384 /NCGR_PEP_ID=MMETSP0417-20130205/377_1 /TAXON_ID=242541 /ORGANISM="Mayorella sp, Strain BSH-02190019" /LENGTH=164 /DNA_ID=CAMNT_0015306925 /DNA_START=105 /DNA_END=599 /DNA_ORIENTATION=-